jgi:hypothetical protein
MLNITDKDLTVPDYCEDLAVPTLEEMHMKLVFLSNDFKRLEEKVSCLMKSLKWTKS